MDSRECFRSLVRNLNFQEDPGETAWDNFGSTPIQVFLDEMMRVGLEEIEGPRSAAANREIACALVHLMRAAWLMGKK